MWVRIPPPALLLLEPLFDCADLVLERLLLVAFRWVENPCHTYLQYVITYRRYGKRKTGG
jgi:hypothetical protein